MNIPDYTSALKHTATPTCERLILQALATLESKGYKVISSQICMIDYEECIRIVTDARTEKGYYLAFKVVTLTGNGWCGLYSNPFGITPEKFYHLVPEAGSMEEMNKLIAEIPHKRKALQ